MKLNVKLDKGAKMPCYGSEWAIGMDIFSLNSSDNTTVVIPSGTRALINTGVRMEWDDPTYYARIAPRSGLSVKSCIDIGAGVIDYDYRGEIKVLVINNGESSFEVTNNMKIAQIIFTKAEQMKDICEVNVLEETVRGSGGFGSTGN